MFYLCIRSTSWSISCNKNIGYQFIILLENWPEVHKKVHLNNMQPLHTLYQYFVILQLKSAKRKSYIIFYPPLIPPSAPPPPVLRVFFFFAVFKSFFFFFAFKIFVAFEAKYSGFGIPVQYFSCRAHAENK